MYESGVDLEIGIVGVVEDFLTIEGAWNRSGEWKISLTINSYGRVPQAVRSNYRHKNKQGSGIKDVLSGISSKKLASGANLKKLQNRIATKRQYDAHSKLPKYTKLRARLT